MSINISNIIAALEAKVAAATSSTQTEELIVLLKTIKAANQETVVTYATTSALPAASTDNVGSLAYVAADQSIYFSNGTAWTQVGSGSSGGGGGGGTAYDQSLNTTDDVVFNSGLIGDVSIIANEITGVNSYGLPSDLVLTTPVNFKGTEIIDNQFTLDYQTTAIGINVSSNILSIGLQNDQTVANAIINSPFMVGELFQAQFYESSSYSTALIRCRIGSKTVYMDPYNPSIINGLEIVPQGDIEFSLNAGATWSVLSGSDYLSGNQLILTGGSITTTEKVVATVSQTGALTVNGQDVTLTVNADKSKSIPVNTVSSSTVIVNMDGYGDVRWDDDSGKYYFFVPTSVYTQYKELLKAGTVITGFYDEAGKGGAFSLTLKTNMTSMMLWAYTGYAAETVEANPSNITNIWRPEVTTTNVSGSLTNYDFTPTGLIAPAALIGDVSIIANEISATDSYGLPSTLVLDTPTIEVPNDLTLAINGLVTTTETVSDPMNMNQFVVSDMGGRYFAYYYSDSNWTGYSKFKNGTIVSLTGGMGGTVVVQLTEDMSYNNMNMRWDANYTLISGTLMAGQATAYSVTVTNQTGANANYLFDDNGTFTAPAVNTTSLLINGAPAGLVTINNDGSQSLIVNTEQLVTETVSADMASQFRFENGTFKYNLNDSGWTAASKFKAGTTVFMSSSMYGDISVTLTSDISYGGMASGWSAPYVINSGSDMGMPSGSTVTVTNLSGSITSYEFSDDGVFVAPTVSTSTLLVDGAPAGLLTTNLDGSQSVIADTTVTTTSAVNALMPDSFNMQSGMAGSTPYFKYSGSSNWTDGSKFVKGSLVTGSYMGTTATIKLTSDMTYDMMFNEWRATYVDVVGTASQYGLGPLNSVTVVTTTGSIADYNFSDSGTFTTTSLLADSALIGDVSVIANTISGVDSYGNAGTLIVDGNLDINNPQLITTNYTWNNPVSLSTEVSTYPSWNNTYLTWPNSSDQQTMTLVLSLKAGDIITFTDNMYYEQRTVTLSSAFTYDMGSMGYKANVVEKEPTFTGLNALTSSPLVITTTQIKTTSFDVNGLQVDGNLVITGEATFGPISTSTPTLTGAPKKWLEVKAMAPEVITTPTQYYEGVNYTTGELNDASGVELKFIDAYPSSFPDTVWTSLMPGDTIDIYVANDNWYTVTLITPAFAGGAATIDYTVQLAALPGTYSSPLPTPLSITRVKINVKTEGTNLVPTTYYMPLYQ